MLQIELLIEGFESLVATHTDLDVEAAAAALRRLVHLAVPERPPSRPDSLPA